MSTAKLSLSATSASITQGASTAMTTSVTYSNGTTTPEAALNFLSDGKEVGSAVTGTNGQATSLIPPPPPAPTPSPPTWLPTSVTSNAVSLTVTSKVTPTPAPTPTSSNAMLYAVVVVVVVVIVVVAALLALTRRGKKGPQPTANKRN